MIVEGSKVAYAGDDPMNQVGSIGKVLSFLGSDGASVMWQSGPRAGMVESLWTSDLVPHRTASLDSPPVGDSFDAALDMATPEMGLGVTATAPGLQVRATYDNEGEDGLVSALNEAGRIATLCDYADEAVAHVATRIRHDPGFSVVLAALEPDEADSLVSRVASVVLTDRIAEEG